MILVGKVDRVLRDASGAIVSFSVPNYQATQLNELDKGKDYKIELTEVKSKRSLIQNKYMWALIHEIAKHEGMEADEVYCHIIKQSGIKTEFIETIPEAVERFKRVFRVVVERDRRTSPKGVETVVVQCYYGTSTFDTKEMSDFIDRMLDYAANVGLDLSEYKDVWR
jgi:hypothetical protein